MMEYLGAWVGVYTSPGCRDTDLDPASGSCGRFAHLVGDVQWDLIMIHVRALSAASNGTLSQG
jgi:hypothetical protein